MRADQLIDENVIRIGKKDIYHFIGITIIMTLNRRPSYKDY